MCDAYTDVANKEQLSFCLRWIDENLCAREDFLGYYELPYTTDGLSPTAAAYHPSNPKEHYFEVLDAVINVIKERFDQPSFQAYLKSESFLLKVITRSCVEKEKEFLNEKYGDGDVELLESEEVWKTIFSDLKPVCFKDILEQLKSLSEAKKKMIPSFINICKVIIVNPATSCTPE